MTGTTSVLIVDDSALMRQLLTSILSSDPGIEVLGSASDPIVARKMIKELNPDVITLDIEMPKMDGLSFLEKIMTLRPMPVVMVSTLTQEGAEATIRSLELGAVDVIGKPQVDLQRSLEQQSERLCSVVKAAGRAHVKPFEKNVLEKKRKSVDKIGYASSEVIIAIGSSTGGVESIRRVVQGLPPDGPAVLITQHMPGGFTRTFAERLNRNTDLQIAEATQGQRVLPGHVYIAPGTHHLKLARSGANYICKLDDSGPVTGHMPSVDVLFESVASAAGSNAVGAILTGMGRDGAKGLLCMRKAGCDTFGQDERSSVVYGMPRAAFEIGAVTQQLPLERIADAINESVRKRVRNVHYRI